ncbi:hypothetical protein ACJX0J_012518, partial [Zea mays]
WLVTVSTFFCGRIFNFLANSGVGVALFGVILSGPPRDWKQFTHFSMPWHWLGDFRYFITRLRLI